MSGYINEYIKVTTAVEYIMAMSEDFRAEYAIVLDGTSMDYNSIIDIDYNDIPYFPMPLGNSHNFSCAIIGDKNCFVINNMPHSYDGFNEIEVIRPIRILKGLGVSKIILTSNVSSVNLDYEAGEIMLINDHINLSGHNPLSCGQSKDFGERFPDMTFAYSNKMKELAHSVADSKKMLLNEGVLMRFSGPSGETPAEVKVVKLLGADVIGLSSVYECIAAVQAEMEILSLGCIMNMASGLADCKLCVEMIEKRCRTQLTSLIEGIINKLI